MIHTHNRRGDRGKGEGGGGSACSNDHQRTQSNPLLDTAAVCNVATQDSNTPIYIPHAAPSALTLNREGDNSRNDNNEKYLETRALALVLFLLDIRVASVAVGLPACLSVCLSICVYVCLCISIYVRV